MNNNLSTFEIFKNVNFFLNKKIKTRGWVKNKRYSKIGILFISINDGSSFNNIQIIVNNKLINYNIKNITIGSSLFVRGLLIKSIGKDQLYEIKALEINIINNIINPESYPISKKKHSFEFLRKIPHLRVRTKLFSSIFRIKSNIIQEIHNFMRNNNFICIQTPIITSYDTEGNSKLFTIFNENNIYKKIIKKENNKNIFLTVSGQLNLESYVCALSKVYTFSPVFRAENSNTRKHLSEFWMLEIETAFSKIKDIILLSELLIKHICLYILNNFYNDIIFIYEKNNLKIEYLHKFINNKFYQINYSEIINIINKSNIYNIKWGQNLSTDHEKYILNYFNNFPIAIKNFPKEIKPFYMKLNRDEKTVSSVDILLPNVGEVIGGSEREYKYNILKEKIKKYYKNNIEYYNWYMDLRKYGTIPHSGFGIGFERLMLSLFNINNIKDIIPFPRTPNNFNY